MTVHIQFVSMDRPGAEQEDAGAFAARLDRVAGVLRKLEIPKFDLLGVSSAFAPISGIFPLPEERKIPSGGGSLYAVEALAELLGGKTDKLFHFLSSEQGILGRAGRAAIEGEWMYRNIGPYLPGALRRCAVAGRIKLAEGDAVLPFFVVRISPKTSNAALRQAQVMGLIAMAKETWTQGDLTPIVVGDFGFQRDNKTLWEMMCTDFDEVTTSFGHAGTEHVWLGKESAFRGAKGTLAITKVTRLPQLDDGGKSLTSHAGLALEAEVRTWRSKRSFNASPRARSRGGPALGATPGSVLVAWSARQTSGQVSVSRTEDGVTWSQPIGLEGHTNLAPAMCALGDKVLLAWTEQDGRIAVATSSDDGRSFGSRTIVPDATSEDGPALLADGGVARLYYADKRSGQLVAQRSQDGVAWAGRTELPFSSKFRPAAASFDGRVWLAWTEKDRASSVSVATSADGERWDGAKTSFADTLRRYAISGPTFLVHDGRLTLAWISPREANGYAWFAGMYPHLLDDYYRDYFRDFVQWTSTTDGKTWSMERVLDERSEHPPSLAAFGGHVYLAWTGIDSANLVNVKISADAAI
jgi:hypothetical protein